MRGCGNTGNARAAARAKRWPMFTSLRKQRAAGSQFLLGKHMICGQGLPQPYEGVWQHRKRARGSARETVANVYKPEETARGGEPIPIGKAYDLRTGIAASL